MEDYLDKLKEYYESKQKIQKSKTSRASKASKNIDLEIDRVSYYYNKEYLQNIENQILEEKKKIIITKYNILYGLSDDLDTYDEIETNITKLKEERDKIKIKIEHKEEKKNEAIQQLKSEISLLQNNYKIAPEDREDLYKEIQDKRGQINDIMKDNWSIILKESKRIYTLVHDYQPIAGNEIKDAMILDSESQNSVSIEVENI
jgi:hypothetical protein